jgi:phosphogluconate dehydratase
VREQAAQGLVGREELLQAESQAYHGMGTCTFYGTANSNQMLLEAMGLHVPGTAFVNPGTQALREELTREAVRTVLGHPAPGPMAGVPAQACAPIGHVVDERCIVNAMVALLATGGSTNHLIHWVAVARAAGIVIDWDDFRRAVRGGAAAGARLSQRQCRCEPFPGRRWPGLRDPRTARCRADACRRG